MLFVGNDDGRGGDSGPCDTTNVVLELAGKSGEESFPTPPNDTSSMETPPPVAPGVIGSVLEVSSKIMSFVSEMTGLTSDSKGGVKIEELADSLSRASSSLSVRKSEGGGDGEEDDDIMTSLVNLSRCFVTSQDLTPYESDEYSKICTILQAQDLATRGKAMTSLELGKDVGDQSWLLAISEYDHESNVGRPYMKGFKVRDRETGVIERELIPSAVWSALLIGYSKRHYKFVKGMVESTERKMTLKFGKKMNNKNEKVSKRASEELQKYQRRALLFYHTHRDHHARPYPVCKA